MISIKNMPSTCCNNSTACLANRADISQARCLSKNKNYPSKFTKDDCEYENSHFAGSFTKGLKHSPETGVLSSPSDYVLLASALYGKSIECLNKVPEASPNGQLVAPAVSFTHNLFGENPEHFDCIFPKAPRLTSEQKAAEYIELLLRAAARDVAFSDFGTSHIISSIVEIINQATANQRYAMYNTTKEVTAQTVFRGSFPGEREGDFLSCLITDTLNENGTPIPQEYIFPTMSISNDFLTTIETASAAQNGDHTGVPIFESDMDKRRISTLRDLAEFVHADPPVWIYHNAAMVIFKNKVPANPYLVKIGRDRLANGLVDATAALGETLRLSITTAWYYKWRVNRTLRPEAYGILLARELASLTNGKYIFPNSIRNSQTLTNSIDLLESVNGSVQRGILPQCYPEGSPQHPAYPAGHAVIAGALCTVLKAFFDTNNHNANNGQKFTHELDKLAANISYGRNAAGVHYASDGYHGILLGEAVACKYLSELITTFPEVKKLSDPCCHALEFVGFRGDVIKVYPIITKPDYIKSMIIGLVVLTLIVLFGVVAYKVNKGAST